MNTNLSLIASDNRKRKMKETLESPGSFSGAPGASGSRQPVFNDNTRLRLGTGGVGGGVARPPPAVVNGGGNVGGGGGGNSVLNVPFKSYTSLLMDGDDYNTMKTAVETQKRFFVDGFSKCYDDRVREVLDELFKRQYSTMMTAADERAAKRAREHAKELRRVKAWLAKMEKEMANTAVMAEKIKTLEEVNAALKERFKKVEAASKVVPKNAEEVELRCQHCSRRMAVVMLFPCRHISLCLCCKELTGRCPICNVNIDRKVGVALND